MFSELEQDVTCKILLLRCIQRLISLPDFKKAYNFANKIEREQLTYLINVFDKEGLNMWMEALLEKLIIHNATNVNTVTLFEVRKYTLKKLQIYAKQIGILYYQKKSKYVLLTEIEEYINMCIREQKLNVNDKLNVNNQNVWCLNENRCEEDSKISI